MQSPDKVPSVSAETTRESVHNNPTCEIDSEETTNANSLNQQNSVHDQTGEYTYIESNPSPRGNDVEDVYTYAETPVDHQSLPSSNKDAGEYATEGWEDNTIYITSDDASAPNDEDGWTENSVYGK